MRLTRAKRFEKVYRKLPKRIQEKVDVRLAILVSDPFDRILENHPLAGEWAGFRSINISGDLRAIYAEIVPGIAHLMDIGTHHELYGK